jgi:N-acetylglutamate synthase
MDVALPDLVPVVEATWPPLRTFRAGPWRMKEGAGGGSRVSSATAEAPVTAEDLALLHHEARALGQQPQVMVRQDETALDALLDRAGWQVLDPTRLYLAPVRAVAAPVEPVRVFPHWPRLAITEDIWAEAGTGPARLAVMDRAAGRKAAILSRTDDTPSGAAFVALHGDTAMIHAVEVSPRFRRRGVGRQIVQAAANWAQDVGAAWFSLAVTERNAAARALYASLNMQDVGHYHYRSAPGEARAE